MVDGILNVLKPPGMTSHDVVYFVRRVTGVKKCGHTGTLDPGAAGVLPICIGRATRLARFVTEGDKIYRGELTLGITTHSQDAFGEVLETQDASNCSCEQLEAAMAGFIGEIQQTPPMASAIKVNGKRLYQLDREGKSVEVPTRTVKIFDINMIKSWDWHKPNPRVLFDVKCSKGTYVRTLCADIGKVMGCGAYMSFLLRSRVGNFDIGDALTLEEIASLAERKQLEQALLPMPQAVSHLTCIEILPSAKKAVSSGATLYPAGIRSLTKEICSGDLVRIQLDDQLLAIYKACDDPEGTRLIYKPDVVLAS